MTDVRWRVWIDTGGTFTDCLAVSDSGEARRRKVLSSARVRARIVGRSGSAGVLVEPVSGAEPGFFRSFRARLPGRAEEFRVRRHGGAPESHLLEFESPLPSDFDGMGESAFVELDNGFEAPVLALHLLFAVPPESSLPSVELRLGTTRGTNALLERKGARSALVVTKGFKDLLEIGNQARPDIFAIDIQKPEPLYERVVEVAERTAADGTVLLALDGAATRQGAEQESSAPRLQREARTLVAEGFDSAAVGLLHSYKNPANERRAADILRDAGLAVSSSSELSRLTGYLARTQTAMVDAYLSPVLSRYLEGIRATLGSSFLVMTSAGGLLPVEGFRAKDSLLSGPAGGVVGCAEACRLAGIDQALAFDMGGTSTDVSRFSGDFEYDNSHQVAGATVLAPALALRTVAAGGGSICLPRNGQLAVGPESAGADPGPACYGRGGPLTVTDINLVLGRIDGQRFEVPLDRAAAEARIDQQLLEIPGIKREELLEGYLKIANERMAETIRQVSTRKGFDPKTHALVAFGGAGGQHACALADLLEMEQILVPHDCSLLSARGIGAASLEAIHQRQILLGLDHPGLDKAVAVAERAGVEEFEALFGTGRPTKVATALNLRYVGQDSGLELALEPRDTLRKRFDALYEEIFGYLVDRKVEVEWARIRVQEASRGLTAKAIATQPSKSTSTVDVWTGRQMVKVPLIQRDEIPLRENIDMDGRTSGSIHYGKPVEGPALITEEHSSTWLAEGWYAFREPRGGGLVLQRSK